MNCTGRSIAVNVTIDQNPHPNQVIDLLKKDSFLIDFLVNTVDVLGAALYSGIGTFVLLKALSLFTPLRKPSGEEGIGLDVVLHGEEGYAQGEGAVLVQPE